MITCPSCGYPNDEPEYRCERCGRRFAAADSWSATVEETEGEGAAQVTAGAPPAPLPAVARAAAAPSLWRDEVSSRVERFRERRRAQHTLPLNFESPEARPEGTAPPAPRFPPEPLHRVIPFKESAGAVRDTLPPLRERVGAARSHPKTRLPSEDTSTRTGSPARHFPPRVPPLSQASLGFPRPLPAPAETRNFPLAPLPARLLAAAADAAVLTFGYALFLAVYTLVGGKFPLQHVALLAHGAALAVLAFIYMALFLYFSSTTPGMRWMSLRLVDQEGLPARRESRAVRLLGLVASASSLGLGFLWALVDEDGLTWHDRISQTYPTVRDSPSRRAPRLP